MRRLILLLSLAAAPALLGATADLRILSILPTKTELVTGERFTASMRWRNDGPDAAGDVVATLSGGAGAFVVTAAGTSHWPCEPDLGGESFTCKGIIPAGGEAEMVVTMLAPPNTNAPFTLHGSVSSSATDPAAANNSAQQTLHVTAATRHADLGLAPSSQTHHAAAGSHFTMPLLVSNAGPDAAHNVIVSLSFAPGDLIPISVTGEGWSCHNATHSPQLVACSRDVADPGTSSTLTIDVTAPQHDGTYAFSARVSAEQYADGNLANQQSTASLQIGEAAAEAWTRILVPLIPNETPGANGSLWKTETTMLIRSDTPVVVEPNPCDLLQPCDGETTPPVQVPFSIGEHGLSNFDPHDHGGQFLYVPVADAAKVSLNSRVWDLSRAAETAGSEIPIVRERRFTTGTIALLGIPVASQYRHTLRVYDFDGHSGARVAIRVYANDELDPRATTTRELTVSPYARTTTSEHLPTHPAYLELNPAALLPSTAGITTLRIEIAPLDGARIWSFVSVTNNDTHHVTTVSAR